MHNFAPATIARLVPINSRSTPGKKALMGLRKPILTCDGATTCSRRFTVAVWFLCILVAFLVGQAALRPVLHRNMGFRWAMRSTNGRVTRSDSPAIDRRPALETTVVLQEDDMPPRLSELFIEPPRTIHEFTVPDVLTYYEDKLPNNRTKLYLITAGIMMMVSKRNLNAVACQVGNDVYEASIFISDILHCEIPRSVRRGERLAAVLAWDDQLKRAVEGPVTLATGIVATISPGDIEKLPDSAILRGSLAPAGRNDFRVARSNVHFGASDNFDPKNAKSLPRYRLCLMTMVAPNSHMLKDWANYHRRIGVDQVYIFDNGAKRDLQKMFQDRVDVEIISWPYHKSQIQAVSMFMFASRARCERVLLEDSDEYPMFGLGDGTSLTTGERPLIRYARKLEQNGFLNYKLLHVVMVNSGYLHRPKGEVPMNFIHRRRSQTFRNGKSVCYTDLEWQCGAIHHCGTIDGEKPEIYQIDIHAWGEQKMTPEDPDDPPYLMHFRDRSWEDYIEKWDAGRVAGRLVNDEKAGSMTMDEPDEGYMKVKRKLEYTHFRDTIYKRVMKNGTMDEQTIVQTIDGKRCEKQYKIDAGVRRFVQKVCLSTWPVVP